MLSILVVCLALGGVGASPAAPPPATPDVPDEPDAVVLSDRPTLQAVVADLEGSGARDLVRLVQGERGSVIVEVWRHADGGWSRVGDDVEAAPEPSGGTGSAVGYGSPPARLVVRDDGPRELVTLVRQPHFLPPGLEPRCCLQLHDVLADAEGVRLRAVGSAREAVDALLALDLDGDGIDELLASRSLPPLGRTAYPSEALVFRWNGDRFSAPTLTELSVGSGDTPFILGETDGVPGEEAALIGRAAQSILYRLVLEDGDRIRAESAGVAAEAVAAVPLGDGTGVAIVGPLIGLAVHRWPADGAIGPPLGRESFSGGRLVGAVEMAGGPVLLVERDQDAILEAFSLPELERRTRRAVGSVPALSSAASTPLRTYRGLLPGGGPNGEPVLLHDGVMSATGADAQAPSPALADAQPIGLAGPGRSWIALAHGMGVVQLDRAGGRLESLGVPSAGSVSLVPVDRLAAERDDGVLEPEVVDAFVLDGDGTLGIPPSGFGASFSAPAGSRVHAGLGDGSPLGVQVVPASGRLEVRLPLPSSVVPYSGDRAWVAVVTPAGATYLATWTIVALTGPPPLEAGARTPLGSVEVEVHGQTVPYATVSVGGRTATPDAEGAFVVRVTLPPWPTEVAVVAVDPVGNAAHATVSGVGIVDYRALPWIPITVVLLVGAAATLYVRAPRSAPAAPRRDDGASLEEVDPERES